VVVSAFIVSHPHVAPYSLGQAQGLSRAGQLAAYVTGIAVTQGSLAGMAVASLAGKRPVLGNRLLPDDPGFHLRSLAPLEAGARASAEVLRRLGVRTKAYDVMFPAHDLAVSLMPWPAMATGVYAYEDGAAFTFRRARRREMARVWDLPLPHYRTIRQTLEEEARRWPTAMSEPPAEEPPWKLRRKDEELSSATTISVASTFTRQSLERAQARQPIVTTPYGFPVDSLPLRERPPSGRFTALSVGMHDLRKGTPYLLEAWKRAAIPDAELRLVGPLRLSKPFLDGYAGLFTHVPHVPKRLLGAEYSAADVLVFPTLGDGFGIVIQEAMSCGTPVITTPCGGGPECITDGVDGWLVPPRDIDALVHRLREAAAGRDRLVEVGHRARARAERWTWLEAGQALAAALAA
jgi:glycosyltransferase involved in cell wall biosynthesis